MAAVALLGQRSGKEFEVHRGQQHPGVLARRDGPESGGAPLILVVQLVVCREV